MLRPTPEVASFAARANPDAALEPDEAWLTGAGRGRDRIALCLSGGGFRAALFHLGALRRLNELGLLGRIDTVASVSGGSILAAHLARRIRPWPAPGEAVADWDARVAMPFRDFVSRNLRTPALLRRLAPWNWGDRSAAARALADLYGRRLTADRMADLPQSPRFVFCATDMCYGAPWRFTRDWMGDGQVGYAPTPPDFPVARAVAASSCFPPVFNPIALDLAPERFTRHGAAERDGRWRALASRLELSDGGLYDNLGLSVAWNGHKTLLVSDGGATFDPRPGGGLFRRLARYMEIQGKSGWDERIQRLTASHATGAKRGAYWLVGQGARPGRNEPGYPAELVDRLISEVRTDMDAFRPAEVEVLENHGYLVAATKLARFAGELAPGPAPDPVAPHPRALEAAFVERHLRRSSRRVFLVGRMGRGAYSRRRAPPPRAPGPSPTGRPAPSAVPAAGGRPPR